MVGNAVFPETALRIFLIFRIKLADYKGRKMTEPDFWKKFLIWRYSWKRLQISPKSDTLIFGWLVGRNAVFSETAVGIFLIFLHDYKGRKMTEPDFWKKFLIWRYSRKRSPKSDVKLFSYNSPVQSIYSFISKEGYTIVSLPIISFSNRVRFAHQAFFSQTWSFNNFLT